MVHHNIYMYIHHYYFSIYIIAYYLMEHAKSYKVIAAHEAYTSALFGTLPCSHILYGLYYASILNTLKRLWSLETKITQTYIVKTCNCQSSSNDCYVVQADIISGCSLLTNLNTHLTVTRCFVKTSVANLNPIRTALFS